MSSEYERKLIEMQYQMRENNAYLTDYMKDLNDWTDDIKKKEQNLKDSSNSTASTQKDLPPVRNFIEPPKPKRKPKAKTSSTNKSSSIRSYDYRAWDKFDVDAECERIDKQENEVNEKEEEEQEEAVDDENDEEWQEEVLQKKAEYYKDCGNFQFKQKSYSQAIEFYTKAIECNPTSPVYFANRAQCQLFEQRYGACESDCTLAIQLDKNYLKAYYRRALARIQLDKTDRAREDLEYVLKHEPSNADAKNKLEELNRNDEIKRLGRVYPLHDKPVDKRSTKPLKRIEIQEIDTSVMTINETTKKKHVVIEEIDTSQVSTETTKTSLSTNPDSTSSSLSSSSSSLPSSSISSQSSTKNENPIVLERSVEPKQQTVKTSVSITTAIPTSGFQFKRDWVNLNNRITEQTAYFNRIPPTSYKTIFSTGIDSSIFSKILFIWSNHTDSIEHLIDSMYEMRKVPRFDTQISFLGNSDKQLLKTVLERLQNESLSNDKIQSVISDYKID